jgi:hypothetical protein
MEAISKIIVYGLLFTCPTTDPALKPCMVHRNERRPSIFSIKEDVQEDATYTQHHKIPKPQSSASSMKICTTHPCTTVTAEQQVMATLNPDDEF